MPRNYDVVVVGGGGMGSSAAFFLARLGGGRLSVAVIEQDPSYARAATALSAGGIRQQFSTPENIVMSQFGYGFLSAIGRSLAVGEERPDVGLTPRPYLRLVDSSGREALERQCRLQRLFGAGSTLLEPGALARRFDWMRLDGVAAGVLGGEGEGLFDPYSMLQAFRKKAASLGVEYVTDRATGLRLSPSGRRITHVRLHGGGSIGCGQLVNAAGPSAAAVAAMAGVELPVRAAKAHSFAFETERPIPDLPVILDHAGGMQLKPEGRLFLCSAPSREAEAPPAEDDFEVEPDLFEERVWPRVAARVPQFEKLRLVRSWVGHIEVNLLDRNPVIGPHPEVANLFFLNGFSGHGAQHVPAAGRAIAELIVQGGYRSVDLSRFGYARILENAPVREEV